MKDMYSNYPPGAANDPNAPYNQVSLEPREFQCTVETTLVRKADVMTDNYDEFFDEEDGSLWFETHEDDWSQRFRDDYLTIPQLLDKLKEYVQLDIEKFKSEKKRVPWPLQLILDSCDGWEEEELSVEKE